jgi:hypothetical protein
MIVTSLEIREPVIYVVKLNTNNSSPLKHYSTRHSTENAPPVHYLKMLERNLHMLAKKFQPSVRNNEESLARKTEDHT